MTTTIAEECRDAVVSTIRSLNLDGVALDEVVPRDAPDDWTGFKPRGISVVALEEQELPGTNRSEDYGYPFLIIRASGTGKGRDEMGAVTSRWRDAIRKAFNQRRLAGVAAVWICIVNNGDFLPQRPWEDNRALSSLVVTCWARERRV